MPSLPRMDDVAIKPLSDADSAQAAALHALCFPVDPWPEKAFVNLLVSGAEGFIAIRQDKAIGVILIRAAGDEAEILTFAIAPTWRRYGLGRSLLERGSESLSKKGIDRLFLEVAKDNVAAFGLYSAAGFVSVGDRSGYYAGKNGATDAYIMMKQLRAID